MTANTVGEHSLPLKRNRRGAGREGPDPPIGVGAVVRMLVPTLATRGAAVAGAAPVCGRRLASDDADPSEATPTRQREDVVVRHVERPGSVPAVRASQAAANRK